jgi:tetratricopeptide (TPR) repeat protein
MVCPHCGTATNAVAGRCTSCNGILDQPASRRVAAGVLTPVHTPPPAEDVTRLATNMPNLATPNPATAGGGLGGPDATVSAIQATGIGLTGATGAAPLTPGQSFGSRYHVIRLLGVGGMGAVYQAWDDELGVAVAIKVIRPEITADPVAAAELHRRFKRELLLARQVTHRNVVRIHDLGEIGGIKYITMPFIEGEDLATVLRTAGRLPVSKALNLAKQIVAGLRAAHEAGVVHRDLKPANIMVEEERAVIMDFGIARAEGGGGSTVLGTVVGTLEYMAPEQARGEAVDHRADLYALGLILYDMLIGRRQASRPDSILAELMGRMQHAPPSPRTVDPQIPEAVDAIVMRCLQANPADRYQTATELAADLDALDADGHPLAGRTVAGTIAVPRGSLLQRMPRWVWAAVALVIVLAGVGVFMLRDHWGGTARAPVPSGPVTLAILPFRNASGDASLDWVGTSLAEMLRTEVGQSAHLQAVSSDRLHQIVRDLRIATDSNLDPATLQRLADYGSSDKIVWGQYFRFGNEISIDARLEDVKGGRAVQLKARAVNEAALLTAVQQLATAIREGLSLSSDIVKELQASAFTPSSRSVQALRYYSEGLALTRQSKHSEALAKFELSTREDPDFALAHAKLAETYASLGRASDAEEVSEKAVQLGQALPLREKYMIEATHASILHNTEQALESYKNLLKVSPEDLETHFQLAALYVSTGSYDLAHDHLAKVLARDPKYVDALIQSGKVEILRRNWDGALKPLNDALTLAIQLENDEARANALHSIGVVYKRLNKPQDALRNYQQALEIKQRIGQKGSIATTLNEMGQIYSRLGNVAESKKRFEEALALRQEIGDKRGVGSTLIDLGALHWRQGAYDQALDLFKKSLQIQREVGNKDYEALSLNNIGSIYLKKGQYEEARTYFERALTLREQTKVPQSIAETVHNLAETSAMLGEYDEALRQSLRALELLRGAGDKRSAAMELHYMASVFGYQGRYGAALKNEEEALKILREGNDRTSLLAGVLSGHGLALSAIAKFDDATKSLDEALTLSRGLKDQALVAQSLNYKATAAFYRGDYATARGVFQEALTAAQPTKDPHLILVAKLGLAKTTVREGRDAATTLRSLANEADSVGLKHLGVEARIYLGDALLSARSYAEASTHLEGALRASEKLGLRALRAQSHALLAKVSRATGKLPDAQRHDREARRLIDEISKEAGTGDVARRSDLRAVEGSTQ